MNTEDKQVVLRLQSALNGRKNYRQILEQADETVWPWVLVNAEDLQQLIKLAVAVEDSH